VRGSNYQQTWRHVVLIPTVNRALELEIFGGSRDPYHVFPSEYGVPLPRLEDVSSGTHKLLDVSSQMENLQEIRISIPKSSMIEYETVINSTTTPPIKATRVTLGVYAGGILRQLPNVHDVSLYQHQFLDRVGSQKRVMQAIMGKQLERLEICFDDDLPSHIEGTIDVFSHLSPLKST
jgi:hypothetical protein